MLDKLSTIFSTANSTLVTRFNWGYGIREIFPEETFADVQKVLFEGKQYNAPSDYHLYLTNVFGDYMQLPPIDKRVSTHDFEAFKILQP